MSESIFINRLIIVFPFHFGWILKMLNNKRNVLFIVPCKGNFRTAFTFGEKAVDEVIAIELPDFIKHELGAEKKHS
jgi:hypothetical protein